MELKNFISVYDDILPKKVFNKLLKVCKNLEWEEAVVGAGTLDKNIRRVKACNLSDISNSMTEVHWYNVMENIFKVNLTKYVNNNKIKEIYGGQLESMQVLKYNEADHYTWHYDQGPNISRTLSCIYFLNENYEGGELCFKNPDGTGQFSIPKKENRMVIWPSCFLYPHTVKPVKRGERYIIVSWTQ
jgi:predicted 2-oxoglutarate/Fe(II)-dependent dioxygenase YbiX